ASDLAKGPEERHTLRQLILHGESVGVKRCLCFDVRFISRKTKLTHLIVGNKPVHSKVTFHVTAYVRKCAANYHELAMHVVKKVQRLAGLCVLDIVKEPITAANLSCPSLNGRLISLFYFGGGTLDVTLLHTKNLLWQEVLSNGDLQSVLNDRLVDQPVVGNIKLDRSIFSMRCNSDEATLKGSTWKAFTPRRLAMSQAHNRLSAYSLAHNRLATRSPTELAVSRARRPARELTAAGYMPASRPTVIRNATVACVLPPTNTHACYEPTHSESLAPPAGS
ncbi:unnamed protein product, partial [Dovyalis caffra]